MFAAPSTTCSRLLLQLWRHYDDDVSADFVRASVAAMIGAEFGAGRALAAGVAQSAARSKVEFTAVKALVFDTFGTVVDWRTSVSQEVAAAREEEGAEGRRREVRRCLARRLWSEHESRADR